MAKKKTKAKAKHKGKKKDPDKHWIEHMHLRKGALHMEMHLGDNKHIPADQLKAAAKKSGKLGHRARVAITLKKYHRP